MPGRRHRAPGTGNPNHRREGAQVKVNLLLRRLPRLQDGSVSPEAAFGGTFHINETWSQLDSAYLSAAGGSVPSPLPCEIYCHSLTDPSILSPELQAAGAQTLTVFGLHVPDRLVTAENNEDRRAELQAAVLASLNSVLAEPIEDLLLTDATGGACIETKTTLDIERAVGMPRGNIFHGGLDWPFVEDGEPLDTRRAAGAWRRTIRRSCSAVPAPAAAAPSVPSAGTTPPWPCWNRGLRSATRDPEPEHMQMKASSRSAVPAEGSWSPRLALLVAATFFMEFLDGTVLTTAIPSIAADFSVPAADVNITMTAYLMTVAMGIPLSSWLAERIGARRVFCLAIALFTAASLLCALSQDLTMLTLSRVLQGAGGAMMVPVGTLVVLRGTPKKDLLRATAFLVWPGLLAPVLAPLVGGALTTYLSWHWIFLVNLPLGLAAFVAALRLVPAVGGDSTRRLDWLGLALTTLGVGSLLLGLELTAAGTPDCWRPR